MKHLSCFYYICVLIVLSVCNALEYFKSSGTINKIDGHFWSSVFWVDNVFLCSEVHSSAPRGCKYRVKRGDARASCAHSTSPRVTSLPSLLVNGLNGTIPPLTAWWNPCCHYAIIFLLLFSLIFLFPPLDFDSPLVLPLLEFNQQRRVNLSFLQSGVWTSRALPWLPGMGSAWVTTLSWLPLPDHFPVGSIGVRSLAGALTYSAQRLCTHHCNKPPQNVAASHSYHFIFLVTLGAVIQLLAWLGWPWLTSLRHLQWAGGPAVVWASGSNGAQRLPSSSRWARAPVASARVQENG